MVFFCGFLGDENGVLKVVCVLYKKIFLLEIGENLNGDFFFIVIYLVKV